MEFALNHRYFSAVDDSCTAQCRVGVFLFSRSDRTVEPEIDVASLERLAALASTGGFAGIEADARALADRLSEGRFYLACLGQFKRGKSTLIDALLGEPVLPIGVLPVTAVPTVVRYGRERVARVRTGAGEWRQIDVGAIEQYVSEADNPNNERGVTAIEVFMPSSLLEEGMCLVDTPGIDSVFENSTARTRNFIPHIDAAIVVLGADPPISASEANLAAEVARHVKDVIFVMNKADRVSDQDLASARDFAIKILRSRLNRPIEIYEISARQVLDERTSAREWPLFHAALSRLVLTSRRRLTHQSLKHGTAGLRSRLTEAIAEQQDALVRPLEESENRVRRLTDCIAEMNQATQDLGIRMASEQNRLSQQLSARRASFLAVALPEGRNRLEQHLRRMSEHGPYFRRRAMVEARNVARALVLPWLSEQEEIVGLACARTIDRFNEMANDFLRRLTAMAIPQLGHLADTAIEGGQLTAKSSFQFHDLLHIAEPASPFRFLIDLILGFIRASGPIARDADDLLLRLMDTNTSRVEADLEHRLAVARRELELEIRHRLADAGAAASDTLRRARELRASGEDAIQADLDRLSAVKAALFDQVPC